MYKTEQWLRNLESFVDIPVHCIPNCTTREYQYVALCLTDTCGTLTKQFVLSVSLAENFEYRGIISDSEENTSCTNARTCALCCDGIGACSTFAHTL